MPKVTLLSYTPNPQQTIAVAAKLCYSPSQISDIYDGLTEEKTNQFLEMLSEIGHESPIEHVSFTFGIEGVSRALLAQITRHRIASFSVQSQRYVREGSFDFVIPPEIEELPEAKEEFLLAMKEDVKHYNRLTDLLKANHKEKCMTAGMVEKEAERTAEKLAIEDARFVLPNACDTKMIVTMNARSLNNFFRHRCCNRAQWEIRAVAAQMLGECLKVAPILFAKSGPPCLFKKCPEGKMSCKKQAEVREEYAAMKQRIREESAVER